MISRYFPTYSTISNEIVDVKLNLSGYVTQKEFKNLTKVDTSDFTLKAHVAEIKARVDNIDVNKINIVDQLQGKHFVEDSYLYFEPKYRYFETSETNINGVLSWKSIGLYVEIIIPTKDSLSQKLSYESEKIYLSFNHSILAQEEVTYTHDSTVKLYIVYSLINVAISTDYDIVAEFLFGTASLSNNEYANYGVAFGSKIYPHKNSGKNTKNLITLVQIKTVLAMLKMKIIMS